ncbi:MAG: flavodoxin domain-containing protein, partial [Negativicutes bacterium]|nr:flavodoxin domain-containing protein [Negativicutes bacterium]
EAYAKWANSYQENQITVIYDTMWNGTRLMAEAIVEGIKAADPAVTIKVFNSGRSDKTDILTEVFKSKAIVVGSPTVNKGTLSSIAAILEEIKGMAFKNKKAAGFGAYGWSGESAKEISEKLQAAGLTIVNDPLRIMWNPDAAASENCANFGRDFVAKL